MAVPARLRWNGPGNFATTEAASAPVNPRSRDRNAVIIIECTVARHVGPIPIALIPKLGSATKLHFRNSGDITTQTRVVFQGLPRQRIVIIAKTEESAEAKNRIGHFSTGLVDHDPFNRAD